MAQPVLKAVFSVIGLFCVRNSALHTEISGV